MIRRTARAFSHLPDHRGGDVHIRWLREKIETAPAEPRHIITVRGIGYRFEDEQL